MKKDGYIKLFKTIILCACMLVSIVGCGKHNESQQTTETNKTETETEIETETEESKPLITTLSCDAFTINSTSLPDGQLVVKEIEDTSAFEAFNTFCTSLAINPKYYECTITSKDNSGKQLPLTSNSTLKIEINKIFDAEQGNQYSIYEIAKDNNIVLLTGNFENDLLECSIDNLSSYILVQYDNAILEHNTMPTSIESIPTYTYTKVDGIKYAKSSVNVRNLPTQDGEQIGTFNTNDEVTLIAQCNETQWYKVQFGDSIGYVCNEYLVDEKVEIQQPASNPQPQPQKSSVDTSTFVMPAMAYSDNLTTSMSLLRYTNEERVAAGIQPLEYDETLSQIALIRANHMSDNDYFSHYYDGLAQPMVVAKVIGLEFVSIGENIQYWSSLLTTDDELNGYHLYDGYYNSERHYANMMNPKWTKYGNAFIVNDNGEIYSAEIFQ